MRVPASCEWPIRASRYQHCLDTLVLGWPLLFALVWIEQWPAVAVALVVLAWLCGRPPVAPADSIGCDDGQWWIARQQQKRPVRFGAGWRRADLLVLSYGRWPWQVLLLRRQHLVSAEAFRQLRAALNGLLPESPEVR